MSSSRQRWPGRAHLVTSTPLIIAGCAGLWTRPPAPTRLDWETARVDHPFWDFDLGEWGTRLRRRRDFSDLWARGWRAYAQARGLDVGSGPLETAFRLR